MTIRYLGLGALLLAAACATVPPPPPAPQQIPTPPTAEVERVVFLVGDPGEARVDYYPILPRLQRDIEWWASNLEADSAVTVLFLGDIVYPLGLHPPGHELYPQDSAIVADQIALVAGPAAVSRRAQALFMAGNHDWGLDTEYEGYVRLKTLDFFLERVRLATRAEVRLVPPAGTGGPHVVDLGRHMRLILLDTAWWLLDGGRIAGESHPEVLAGIEEAMRTAEGREVMIAAHHPFKSAGPHGGEFSFFETLGLRYFLARSGAILQDLTSRPYRELETGLLDIFARLGPPLIFAGGHEHSLQVFGPVRPNDPKFSLVSGSASKLSSVGREEGMLFGSEAPGYMRVLIEKDGGMTLFVEAADPKYKACPKEGEARATCMAEGIASFTTVHSQRLK